jgi:septal ring factor EnvC (AmiA/AmiB activator)
MMRAVLAVMLLGSTVAPASDASDLRTAADALARERRALASQRELLAQVSAESLRRLDAYGKVRAGREARARARARALASLSRGGIARILFEPAAHARTDQRIALGHTLRTLVRHDLRDLAVHRRAEARVAGEQLAAARERGALGAIDLVHAMQSQALALGGAGPNAAHEPAPASTGAPALELARPVPGAVVARFGVSDDPVLGIPVARNGIELAAERAQLVRAPQAGIVAHTGELPGFERVVVIDHGAGRLTLVARLWQPEVRQGDRVAKGDAIARVAEKSLDDGLGRTVYLELREGGRAIDPLPHLAAPPPRRAEPAPTDGIAWSWVIPSEAVP